MSAPISRRRWRTERRILAYADQRQSLSVICRSARRRSLPSRCAYRSGTACAAEQPVGQHLAMLRLRPDQEVVQAVLPEAWLALHREWLAGYTGSRAIRCDDAFYSRDTSRALDSMRLGAYWLVEVPCRGQPSRAGRRRPGRRC
jgi:hypothetical protein